jgi:hypothetical protein
MPKNMSFSITTQQMYEGTKDVTRRIGWWKLKPGDIVCAVEKGMGLKKGEKVKRIGLIEIVSVRYEHLLDVTLDDIRVHEGFPEMGILEFIMMFTRSHHCSPYETVNRIEFKRLYRATNHV